MAVPDSGDDLEQAAVEWLFRAFDGTRRNFDYF